MLTLVPLALLAKRQGVTVGGKLRNWGLVSLGNLAGALTVVFLIAFKARTMWMPVMMFFYMAAVVGSLKAVQGATSGFLEKGESSHRV